MCRNIRPLYNFEPPATEEEKYEAALQFVRKVSGFSKPSKVNTEPFNQAVDEVVECMSRLFDQLQTRASPKNREEEQEKLRKRQEKRFGSRK